jgi:hypothetical protein
VIVGVYEFSGYGCILHLSTQKIAVIPLERLPPCRVPSDLTIECNWSETGAYLGSPAVEAGEAEGLKLWPYFRDSMRDRGAEQRLEDEMAAKKHPRKQQRRVGAAWVVTPEEA